MHESKLPTTLPAFFWHFIRPYKWRFFIAFIAPTLICLETTVMPYCLKIMVDAASSARTPADAVPKITLTLMAYIGIWLGLVVVFRAQEWLQIGIIPETRAQIRLQSMRYVMGHSHKYFSDHFAGSLSNKINDLARSSIELFYWVNWQFTSTISSILAASLLMGSIHPLFALALVGWFILAMAVSLLFSRRVSRYSERHAEESSMISGKMVDVLANIFNVRIFARHGFEDAYLSKHQAKLTSRHRDLLKQYFLCQLVIEFPMILLLFMFGWLLIRGWAGGWIKTGDFVFILYTLSGIMFMTWRLATSMHLCFDYIGICRQALMLIRKAHDVVDMPDAKPLAVTRGEIVFDNVHFHYIPGHDIFRDKNLTIRAGEKVGLVGFSGSGKSTFVNLILRLFDVESGRILIDGQDIARVTQDSLRASIALIPQDTTLFHRTLMDNIRYGRPETSDAEVIAASEKAHCHEFVIHTEKAYDSLVGERGVKLSGGQRQRIAIARAILKNAPLLILDEATSSLDSITEKTIQLSLGELMRGRTTIVVAHRLSTLSAMDRILVFREGEIIEDGSHTALLAANGHYARLWSMQAGGFLPEDNEQG